MSAIPLKYLVAVNQRSLPEETDTGRTIRYIDIGSVGTGTLVDEPKPMYFGEAPSRARRLVREGDTIVSTVRTYLRAVWPVREYADDLVVSTGFAVLSPGPELDPRFLGWIAQSDPFVDAIVARSVGVSYPAVSPSEIGEIRIDLPTLPAQRSIADYLDAETARIDALVAAKRSLNKKVVERFKAVRDHLVLGGGVRRDAHPVLGTVKRGWQVRRLKFVTGRVAVGVVVNPSSYFAEDGVPFIHGSDVREGRIDTSACKFISEVDSRRLWRSRLQPGDVLVVRAGYPGRAAVVPAELAGANCASVLVVRPGPLMHPDYLAAFLNSHAASKQVKAVQYGAAQEQINLAHIVDFLVPVPPLDEQIAIASELREEDLRTRSLTTRIDRQVKLLQEHRQSLIAGAVSGDFEISGMRL